MAKILGMGLLLVGFYLLGQNIIFVTHSYRYAWYGIPASGSVLAIMGGVLSILFFRSQTGYLGWILLGVGAVLVFLSGGIILRPTSLWDFFIAFVALVGGFQLITSGSIRF